MHTITRTALVFNFLYEFLSVYCALVWLHGRLFEMEFFSLYHDKGYIGTLVSVFVAVAKRIRPNWSGYHLQRVLLYRLSRTHRKTAVVHNSVSLDYASLHDKSSVLATVIADQYKDSTGKALGPNMRVALCMTRGVDLIVAFLAVMKLRAVYGPLDPMAPAARLQVVLADARPAVLVLDDKTVHMHPGMVESAAISGSCVCLNLQKVDWSGSPTVWQCANTRADDGAYLVYTSGSTGTPKGVMVLQAGLMNAVDSMVRAAGTIGFGWCLFKCVKHYIRHGDFGLSAQFESRSDLVNCR